MFQDEFDDIPDDFADIQGVDWAQILAGPSGLNPASTEELHSDLPGNEQGLLSVHPDSSRSSTDYFENVDDYDNLDPYLLAELDRIEAEDPAAPQPPRFMGGAHTQNKRKDVASQEISSVIFKKQRLDDASCLTSPKGKGKMKANDDILRQILSTYEDEMICPICYDFYVLAHVSNPCGHSFCGSCGWEWHIKNRSCPVCRTCLQETSPMIPNITIDNVVERHIQALASSGDQDWEPGGFKAEEWCKRKQNCARDRRNIKSSTAHQTRTFTPMMIGLDAIHVLDHPFHIENDLEANSTTQDTSDIELISRPIRRRRRRRRGTGPTVG